MKEKVKKFNVAVDIITKGLITDITAESEEEAIAKMKALKSSALIKLARQYEGAEEIAFVQWAEED